MTFYTAYDWAYWLGYLDCRAKIVVHKAPWLVIHVRSEDHERVAGSIRMMQKQGTLSSCFVVKVQIDLKWWECLIRQQKIIFMDKE